MRSSILLAAVLAFTPTLALRAEEISDADMKVWRESVDERLKGLHNEVAEFNKVRMDFFSDIRADYVDSPAAGTGESGLYNRRAEAKFYGMVQPNVTAVLGFDFAELKLKDAGIEVSGLPLLVVMGPEVDLKLGQFRMPFGIEAQTSSSATYFAERSFLNGGSGGTKLVGERALGAQAKTSVKTGIVDLGLQGGVFNNLSQDQKSGQNKLATGFDEQDNDQDLSPIGRLALTHAYLAGLLPEKSSLVTAASYGRDSQNLAWRTQDSNVKFAEAVGLDLLLKLGKLIVLQAEWVRTGTHTSNGSGVASLSNREAYYAVAALDILPLFSDEAAKGDMLQLLARVEQEMSFPLAGAVEKNRLAFGIKNSYWGGKSHTAVDYFVTANNGQFGGTTAGGPSTMVVLQQQFAFESGKPKWMEKEAE